MLPNSEFRDDIVERSSFVYSLCFNTCDAVVVAPKVNEFDDIIIGEMTVGKIVEIRFVACLISW